MTKSSFYTLLDHTADLGMCVRGITIENLFENAGKALLEQLIKIRQSSKKETLDISLSGTDLADLMVRWLSEILYTVDGENLAIEDIWVNSIQKNQINSTLRVTPFNIDKHDLIREIKAVTYHQIEVNKMNNLWVARVIFDL